MNVIRHFGLVGVGLAAAMAVSVPVFADDSDGAQIRQYEVRVTNITRGQQFTPPADSGAQHAPVAIQAWSTSEYCASYLGRGG